MKAIPTAQAILAIIRPRSGTAARSRGRTESARSQARLLPWSTSRSRRQSDSQLTPPPLSGQDFGDGRADGRRAEEEDQPVDRLLEPPHERRSLALVARPNRRGLARIARSAVSPRRSASWRNPSSAIARRARSTCDRSRQAGSRPSLIVRCRILIHCRGLRIRPRYSRHSHGAWLARRTWVSRDSWLAPAGWCSRDSWLTLGTWRTHQMRFALVVWPSQWIGLAPPLWSALGVGLAPERWCSQGRWLAPRSWCARGIWLAPYLRNFRVV